MDKKGARRAKGSGMATTQQAAVLAILLVGGYWFLASNPTVEEHADAMKQAGVHVTLSNGMKMPRMGFGTWKSQPGKVGMAVKHAMAQGYRLIDMAPRYMNEKEIGDGAYGPLFQTEYKRSDFFLASKLWNSDHLVEHVSPALTTTLEDLKIEYLDLWYMHWPVALKKGHDNPDAIQFEDGVSIAETWAAMEEEFYKGRVKALGVSNFNVNQLEELFKTARIRPVVNQIELHPYLPQGNLVRFCRSHNIAVVAYCPIGSPGNAAHNREDVPPLIEHETVKSVASEVGLTPAQVLLKWSMQKGIVPIPKSVTPSRIEENWHSATASAVLSAAQLNRVSSVRSTVPEPVRYCASPHFMKPGVTPIEFWGDDGGELL